MDRRVLAVALHEEVGGAVDIEVGLNQILQYSICLDTSFNMLIMLEEELSKRLELVRILKMGTWR